MLVVLIHQWETCHLSVPVWLFPYYIFIKKAHVCVEQKARPSISVWSAFASQHHSLRELELKLPNKTLSQKSLYGTNYLASKLKLVNVNIAWFSCDSKASTIKIQWSQMLQQINPPRCLPLGTSIIWFPLKKTLALTGVALVDMKKKSVNSYS